MDFPKWANNGCCRKVACKDMELAVAQALRAASALLELANDAINLGALSEVAMTTAAGAVKETAAAVANAMEQDVGKLSPQAVARARHGLVDMETLGDFGALFGEHQITARNAIYLAQAIRYTAEKAIREFEQVTRSLKGA